MAFFRNIGFASQPPAIAGRGIMLRAPRMADFEEWAQLRGSSRAFLAPWEPVWPEDDLSRSAFRRRLRRYEQDLREESGYAFLAFRQSDGALVGGVTLTNLRRGAAQSGSLGYWMGEPYAGRGYMTAAVAALVPFAHSTLRIRRIEAACLPGNTASIRLLERLQFTREGLARQYLSIAGRWQDHLLFAHLATDPLPVAEAPRQ
jgi:ribosomal-protein-alanine N-acetyltransferase